MDYKVLFDLKAFVKIKAYINKTDKEISGLGEVEVDHQNGIIKIVNLYLLPQVCTNETTNLTKDGIAKFYDDIISQNKDCSKIRLWWHSHANLPVFWSKTDSDTINDFDLEIPENNWFLSIVGNREGKIKCRLDIFQPINITTDNLPWSVEILDPEISKEVDIDFENNFKELIFPVDKIDEDIIIEDIETRNIPV
jgi:hypothetical protein